MKALIQKLVEIAAPPGYETNIREFIQSEVESLADEVYVDKLGNLIARKGGPDGMKVLVDAHMDEIGLMASHVDENGFVRFQPLGAVRPQTCLGGRVSFLNGTAGVIGAERLQDLSRIPAFEQLYIDVGATSRADCPVGVGDTAVFERPFQELGGRLTAKALDDRIGVAILIETLHRLANRETPLPHQVFFVFSVQEEVGLRGAPAAAYGLDPDLGLAVDLTSSGDTPKGIRMEVHLGKGPAVKVRDQGMLSDPRVVEWMVKTAEQAEIPFQLEILERGSTDAQPIQLTRRGVPTGCLSIPCRYVHSPSEIVDYEDVQQGVSLLVELLSHPINLGSL